MVGVPARQVGWISEFGEQIPLSLQGEGRYSDYNAIIEDIRKG